MNEQYKKTEINRMFSIRRIQEHAINLSKLERRFSYPDFDASTKYCLKVLEDAGFSNIERISHRADGRESAFDCVMPEAWELKKRSFLQITSPEIPEPERMLADSSIEPRSVAIWSASTPTEGIESELVNFDSIDKNMTNIKDKFIFFGHGRGGSIDGNIYQKLAKSGVAGIAVTDFAAIEQCPDDVYWFNGQGQFGWYHQKESLRLPVFSLPPCRAHKLQAQLKEHNKIFVHAEMHTRIYDGEIYTVTATIPGESKEEYAILAHVYEPFLADNATGFGIAVEIGRIAKALIEKRKGRPFKKTLRIVLSMELYGFSAFLKDPKRRKNITAALNLDGFLYLGAEKLDLRLSLMHNPFFTDLYYHQIFKSEKLIKSPGNLSDDTFGGDPLIGIPTNWIQNDSGIFHHNSGVFFQPDWERIKDLFPVLATAVINLLNPTGADFKKTASLLANAASEELKDALKEILQNVKNRKLDKRRASLWASAWFNYEYKCMKSLSKYSLGVLDGLDWKSPFKISLKNFENIIEKFTDYETNKSFNSYASKLIVKRLHPGSPFSLAKIPFHEKNNFGFKNSQFLFSFFDGKRSLQEAFDLLDCALGNVDPSSRNIDQLVKYLNYLEKYGYVKLERK